MESRFAGVTGLGAIPSAVVVIDVLRAFATAAVAFDRGAERIVLAESPEAARTLRARHPDWIALTDGPPAPGFDTVNSPVLVGSLDLAGRTLVQRTTNGTAGATAARNAPLLLCAGFGVAAATARLLLRRNPVSVTYLVTGDDGHAEEDLACARYIARLASGRTVDPAPYVRRAARSRAAAELAEGVRRGYRGIHPDDVRLSLEADRFAFAMVAAVEDSLTVLRPVPAPPGDHSCLRPDPGPRLP